MADTNKIRWDLFVNDKQFKKAMGGARKELSKTEKATGVLKKGIGAMGLAFGAVQVAQFAGDAIQLAVAAEEVDSKFQAVFGSAEQFSDALREWGDVAGITETDAKDLAATFGNLAMAQGITSEDTQKLALDVATLAGDMASFNDADPEMVFNDLNKALLTTEREGMKKYGIALTESEIKQRALEIATEDGRDEITKADKAYASYEIAVQQAGQAVGDLDRTSESTANRQRQLKATIEELQTEIGKDLLPVYEDLLVLFEDTVPALKAAVTEFGNATEGASDLTQTLTDLTSIMDEGTDATLDYETAVDALKWVAFSLNPVLAATFAVTDKVSEAIDNATASSDLFMHQTSDLEEAMWDLDGSLRETRKTAEEDIDISEWEKLWGVILGIGSVGPESLQALLDAARGAKSKRESKGGGIEHGILHSGGTVPGPRGRESLHMLQGGEIVSTPSQMANRGGGGVTINVEFSGVIGDPAAAAEQILDLLENNTRWNGSATS